MDRGVKLIEDFFYSIVDILKYSETKFDEAKSQNPDFIAMCP